MPTPTVGRGVIRTSPSNGMPKVVETFCPLGVYSRILTIPMPDDTDKSKKDVRWLRPYMPDSSSSLLVWLCNRVGVSSPGKPVALTKRSLNNPRAEKYDALRFAVKPKKSRLPDNPTPKVTHPIDGELDMLSV
jgi:hypothetical protein